MSNTKHTAEPWQVGLCTVNEYNDRFLCIAPGTVGDGETSDMICLITSTKRLTEQDDANAARIVECVNACAGQDIEDVKLATEHKNACMEWERLMMELVGADGTGSVREAIALLKGQRDAAWSELKSIRDHIGADENESTYDEIVRLTTEKDLL